MNLLLILCFVSTLVCFASPTQKLNNNDIAYYGETFYKTTATKESLFAILNGTHSWTTGKYDEISPGCSRNCYSHTTVGYDGARRYLFGQLDDLRDGKGNYVEDVYCGKKFYFRDVNEAMRMHNEVNVEHTWPQSKFTRSFSKDLQKSDLHHLYITDSEANARRGNYDFGEVPENEDELNVQDCSSSRLGRHGDTTFAPPTDHRGNVARSLFYFATRYKMVIDQEQEMVLRQWHKLDPVDAKEKSRHEEIAKIQKVRNPFIDFPNLVDKIKNF